ncbi:FAD-binding oxidoreductase [Sediminibacterium sp.]|uniref:NAD(P)/FAD-dependent oxidoreductase n=1 Tax=Sediminibacterium sp. TaxID=1917865 RepID=UPI00272F7776|nr:FAD-dependent oxidoreductase [Sediminibacterium sp.]MDP2421959.1 FAD-dependent oxidoreductase [Sediminibacterium sp.]
MLSYWEKDSYYADVDIVIIGAGLMGLWSAYELKKAAPSLTITILEKNATPLGASTRNAGFACFGSLTELISDESTMGTAAMLSIVESRFKGIQKIRANFSDEAIQYDACGGFEAIQNDHFTAPNLDGHIHYLNELLAPITGKHQTFCNATKQMNRYGVKAFDHLVYNSFEAGIHSGKLVNELTSKVLALGVRIINGVEVKGWIKTAESVEITTQYGPSIKAKQLIVCVNGFTQTLLPQLNILPARGQILLTKPIKGLALKGTFHFDEGFYYWRNIGNRILIGGARNLAIAEEQTTNLAGSDKIRNHLAQFLATYIDTPEPIEIEQSWSGVMGFTPNKEPLCTWAEPNVLAVIACNGMGVALTPIVAEKVAAMVLAND